MKKKYPPVIARDTFASLCAISMSVQGGKKNSELRIYHKGLHPASVMFTTLPDGLSQALPAFEENLTPHEEDIDIPPSQIQRGNASSQDQWPTQGSTQAIPAELDQDFNFAFKCSEAARTGINGPQKPEELQGEAALRHELLKIAQCKRPFSLGEARQIIKSKAKFRNWDQLSSSIKRATGSLKRLKILVESRPPQTDHYTKKSNTCWVEVAPLTSLSPEAQKEVESLRISRDNFL